MNRIEEIKKRVKAADEQGTASEEWRDLEVEAYRDITYLLSKLEIAEKAMEDVMGVYDNVPDDLNALRKMNRYASEALKAIRE